MGVKWCSKYHRENLVRGRVLGHGQIGTVTYECKDKHTQAVFACKCISKTKLKTRGDKNKVKHELAIMKHLKEHANIVSFYDFFRSEYGAHLVMELCNGGELYDRLAAKGRPRYTEPQAARLMRTIMEAVHTCHMQGVMHRDLKPDNLMFVDKSEDSPLKLIDFGMAEFFEPGQRFYDVLGTHAYMAPEIWKEKGYGPEVDVWSAGVILYFMLSQREPFKGETADDISWETRHGKLDLKSDPWPMVSDSAKSLVRHMLEKSPTIRYTLEEVLNHPWLQVAHGGEK